MFYLSFCGRPVRVLDLEPDRESFRLVSVLRSSLPPTEAVSQLEVEPRALKLVEMVNYSPRKFVPTFPEKPEKCATSLESAPDRYDRPVTDPDISLTPPSRPAPPRPEVVIRPLHTAPSDQTPRAVLVSAAAWTGSFVVLAGIAGVIVSSLTDVRATLEASTAQDNPGYSPTDIADAVTVVLAGSGGGALVLALLALLSLQLLRARKNAGRVLTAIVGVVSIAAGLGFMSLTSAADGIGGGVLKWAPLLYCALVAVAAIAPFAPSVSTWLRVRR